MSTSIWPSLLAFAVVIALIPVALALLKRAQFPRSGRSAGLSLVGGLAVGPRERVAVVEAGGRWLVVGVTSQSINLLAELERPADGAAASAPATPASPFGQLLAGLRRDGATDA
jgi:flagellar protein FliO/FliZ